MIYPQSFTKKNQKFLKARKKSKNKQIQSWKKVCKQNKLEIEKKLS